MEEGSLSSLILLAGLAALHGLIVLAHAALTSNPASLRERSDENDSPTGTATRVTDRLPQLNTTTQLSLLLARVALIAIATVMVRNPLFDVSPNLRFLVVPPVSYGVVLLPLALVVYLLADLLPATVGKARAESVARLMAGPMQGLMLLFSPLTRLFMALETTLARATGGKTKRSVTEDEIILLMEDGNMESEEKQMIRSVLEFRDTIAREVMVPRLDMTSLNLTDSLDDALTAFDESGHSRIPVYEQSIDDIKGLLYAKDLLKLVKAGTFQQKSIAAIMRPAYFVPETKRADRLFKEMQQSKVHLAIVTDEYGGTAGLVTIEDLVEEIVGDIQDEYDLDEEADYVEQGVDEYLVDAGMNLDDFGELLDVELSDQDNDTLGGYIIGQLEHVPEEGEIVETDRLILRVASVDGRRVRKVHVTRRMLPDEMEDLRDDDDDDEPPQSPNPTLNGGGMAGDTANQQNIASLFSRISSAFLA